MEIRNFGILTSIDWNSYKWNAYPSDDDLAKSNFGFVKDNADTHTYLNFGHNAFDDPNEAYYYGNLPQLWSKTLDKEKSKYLEVIFIKSQDWHDKKTYLVGLYAFPIFERRSFPSPLKPTQIEKNVKALKSNIHLLDNYIDLKENRSKGKFLPVGKEEGKQGFNYLTKENVFKILDAMTELNQNDKKLSSIKLRLLQALNKK